MTATVRAAKTASNGLRGGRNGSWRVAGASGTGVAIWYSFVPQCRQCAPSFWLIGRRLLLPIDHRSTQIRNLARSSGRGLCTNTGWADRWHAVKRFHRSRPLHRPDNAGDDTENDHARSLFTTSMPMYSPMEGLALARGNAETWVAPAVTYITHGALSLFTSGDGDSKIEPGADACARPSPHVRERCHRISRVTAVTGVRTW